MNSAICTIHFKPSFELYAQVFENIVHIKNIRVIYERQRYKIKEN